MNLKSILGCATIGLLTASATAGSFHLGTNSGNASDAANIVVNHTSVLAQDLQNTFSRVNTDGAGNTVNERGQGFTLTDDAIISSITLRQFPGFGGGTNGILPAGAELEVRFFDRSGTGYGSQIGSTQTAVIDALNGQGALEQYFTIDFDGDDISLGAGSYAFSLEVSGVSSDFFFGVSTTVPDVNGDDLYVNGVNTNSNSPLQDITYSLNTIPEPASLALLGLGGLMMLRRR